MSLDKHRLDENKMVNEPPVSLNDHTMKQSNVYETTEGSTSLTLNHYSPQLDNTIYMSPEMMLSSNPHETNKQQQQPGVFPTETNYAQTTHPPQNPCNQEALNQLLQKTGYPLVQENGQRKYGPAPNWSIDRPEPDRGCEVFVGKIPRDCFEYEIVPILERVGMVYEFRLMMEYSGYNRGYGFVMYTTREDAKKAVRELNNFEIRKGRMIGLCRSVDNCRLFVGGIPKSKKREEILEEMKKVTEDVVNVIVYPSATDKSKNRGFAFVQYTTHRAAAIARRKLIPNRIQLFGQPIAVDWAEPEPEVDEDVMATVKVLYVRNLMLSTGEELIKQEFEKIKEGSVERVKKMKDFAFVHFKERDDALNAMRVMNGGYIDGALVEVSLSKPVDKANLLRMVRGGASPNNPLGLGTITGSELNLLLGAPNTAAPPMLNIPFQVAIDPSLQFQFSSHIPTFSPINPANHQANMTTAFLPPTIIPQTLGPAGANYSEILTSYQAAGSLSKPGGRVIRTTTGSRGAGSHRATYYNVAKSVSNPAKKQANNEDVIYDFYSGVKPVPMLPFPVKFPTKPPSQLLEELCAKQNLPAPIYTLHTTSGQDQDGNEIRLYMYKVSIQGFFNGGQICCNRLVRSVEEAKNNAAEFALMQFFNSMPEIGGEMIYMQKEAPFTSFNPQQTIFQNAPKTLQNNPNLVQTVVVPGDGSCVFASQQQQQQQQQTSNASSAARPINQMPEYQIQALVAPQYMLDPNGQYIMCPPQAWQ